MSIRGDACGGPWSGEPEEDETNSDSHGADSSAKSGSRQPATPRGVLKPLRGGGLLQQRSWSPRLRTTQ
jgi:hypothetical protein